MLCAIVYVLAESHEDMRELLFGDGEERMNLGSVRREAVHYAAVHP